MEVYTSRPIYTHLTRTGMQSECQCDVKGYTCIGGCKCGWYPFIKHTAFFSHFQFAPTLMPLAFAGGCHNIAESFQEVSFKKIYIIFIAKSNCSCSYYL